jgi:Arc/MetJ-type ribon-helix-helix transcriptional regulator
MTELLREAGAKSLRRTILPGLDKQYFYHIISIMKTIAITVDEETLDLIDELHGASTEFRSRSALIRAAVREYAAQVHRRLEEERERELFRENKGILDKQLKALVKEQARR